MGIQYEDLKKANDAIRTMTISRTDKRTGETTSKEYAEVNQRIKAFRMVFPEGFITTEMISNQNGICVFVARVGFYDDKGERRVIGTGTAYEKESASFINQTSYIENCETSAVGRALGMAGFGIDTSVASYEEVQNAMANQQDRTASANQISVLKKVYTGDNLAKLLESQGIQKIEDIAFEKASELIGKIRERNGK